MYCTVILPKVVDEISVENILIGGFGGHGHLQLEHHDLRWAVAQRRCLDSYPPTSTHH